MIFKFPMQTSDHPSFFFTSRSIHQCQSAFGKVRPQTQTRRYYDAMSSCKPKTQEYVFFWYACFYFLCSIDVGVHFFRGPCVTLVKNVGMFNMLATATSSVGPVLYSSRTLSHPPTPNPPVDHKRACAIS